MIGPKEKSRTYWPTMVLVAEGNTIELSVFKENGSASHVRKSAVSHLDEILNDVREWIEKETARD